MTLALKYHLKEIFICDNQHIYFHVSQFKNLYFDWYYRAYKVAHNYEETVVNIQCIPIIPPRVNVNHEFGEYVSLRYDV